MLDDADMRFAIDDARIRQKAVIDLINGNSDQALRLLGFYITLGLAATSGAIAGISAKAGVPIAVAIALLSVLVPLVIGSYFCYQTIRPTSIALPGRDPEFWLWAHRSGVTRDDVFKAYLDNLNERMAANRRLNGDTFRIDIAPPEGSKVHGNLTMLLKWSGDWKLTRVFLPMDAFK